MRRACVLAAALLAMTPSAQSKIFHLIDLGSLGGNYTSPTAINNKGQVVGTSYLGSGASDQRAFVWDHGVMTDLGTLGGPTSGALDINDSGIIIGVADDPNGTSRAFLANINGGMVELTDFNAPYAINNSNLIVGTSTGPNFPVNYPIMAGSGPSVTLIEPGWFAGVNSIGSAVGSFGGAPYQPFLYQGSTFIPLPSLDPNHICNAADINDSNLIVGASQLSLGLGLYYHAVVWQNGVIQDVHPVGGRANSVLLHANNRGEAVGESYNSGGSGVGPFYWRKDGQRNFQIANGAGYLYGGWFGINDSGLIVGAALFNGETHGILLDPNLNLKLVDTRGIAIPNDSFQVYIVHPNRPTFTTSSIGTYLSDTNGRLRVPSDSFNLGDMIKVELKVATYPSQKHVATLATQKTIYLDNELIDSLGVVSFDSISTDTSQLVVLDHQTIAFDLLVSIEWDADLAYIASTEQGFRNMADYLYDVSNGQMRLDTVMIFANGAHWDEADYQVHASNMVWPMATAVNDYDRSSGHILLPRKWFGSSDASRSGSWNEDPLDMAKSIDYRTRCHEFGHYGLGFYDEYNFTDWTSDHRYGADTVRCTDASASNYGFMDCQYSGCPPYAQEMSTADRYADAACRNNVQWKLLGMSCWDYAKTKYDYLDAGMNAYVPLKIPSDEFLATGMDYLPGPNDSLLSGQLDYDVGSLVQFPVVPAAPLGRTVRLSVSNIATGLPAPKLRTLITRNQGTYLLAEGSTTDSGQIRILGYESGDSILCYGAASVFATPKNVGLAPSIAGKQWLSVTGTASGGDSVALELKPTAGNFPVIPEVTVDSTGFSYSMTEDILFPIPPTLEVVPAVGAPSNYSFSGTAGGHTLSGNTSLGDKGMFLIRALDDSSDSFFIGTPYTVTTFDSSMRMYACFSAEGDAKLLLDSSNSALNKLLLLSTSYPVLTTGLDPNARQGGQTQVIAADPAGAFSGAGLGIRYAPSDVDETGQSDIQTSLRIFHWDVSTGKWVMIGGSVDTARAEVTAAITETGVYAAFTTSFPTGINDPQNGVNLPDGFELSQNYPNPFNPTTTFEYDLPSRSHVSIEIFNILGQSVRNLIDDEKPAGRYQVVWDGTDNTGHAVSSGVYLYRMTAGSFVRSKKMLLLK